MPANLPAPGLQEPGCFGAGAPEESVSTGGTRGRADPLLAGYVGCCGRSSPAGTGWGTP